jgi:hypothetical protein
MCDVKELLVFEGDGGGGVACVSMKDKGPEYCDTIRCDAVKVFSKAAQFSFSPVMCCDAMRCDAMRCDAMRCDVM